MALPKYKASRANTHSRRGQLEGQGASAGHGQNA